MKPLVALTSFIAFVLIGCSSSNPSDPGTQSTNQDYYPTTQGSKWVYKGSDGSTSTIENSGTSEVNGKTYTNCTQSGGVGFAAGKIRNDGNAVYVINSTTGPNEVSQLEYGNGVGHTWTYTLNISGTVNTYKWTIREMGKTVTVEAGTYNDVLIEDMELKFGPSGSEVTTNAVYYYSKKHGMIKVEMSGLLNLTLEATAITIKD